MSTLIAGKAVSIPAGVQVRHSAVNEHVADPTAPFKFFSLARVGVDVVGLKDGVRLKSVDKNSPFAAAGLAVGDEILAVEGEKVTTPEEAKNRVRTAVARGDGEFTVRTAGKTRDVIVRFPE